MHWEKLATVDVRKSEKEPEWEIVVIHGEDFAVKLYFNNIKMQFYDHYYNIIPRPKLKSPQDCVITRLRIYGLNSIKPYRLTVGRFPNGQYTANYSQPQ